MALRMHGFDATRPPITGLTDGRVDLFRTYREMAEANGVDPEDPVLKPCR